MAEFVNTYRLAQFDCCQQVNWSIAGYCVSLAEFSQWRLPEQFVWLPIVAAFLALLTKGQAHSIGLALLAIALLCYGFQGLAVSLAFFEKWRLPALAEGACVFLLVQGFGLLVFLALGLSDVWINWQKPKSSSH